MSSPAPAGPPDRAARELILTRLDSNLLVEAAAGTGKTTSIVGRMIALLREGRCRVGTLAAVTFTRKAAAELRSRFQVGLERAVREEGDAERRERLEAALAQLGQGFIGTIHSFCARLIRERPVEAGVDPAFEELDDVTDRELRERAWQLYSDGLREHDPQGLLERLDALGVAPGELKPAFADFAAYPDVSCWPVPERGSPPDLDAAARAVVEYAARMRGLWPALPEDPGNDRLIPLYRRIPRVVDHLEGAGDLTRPDRLAELLAEFDRKAYIVQRNWPGGKDQAQAEQAAFDGFRESVARPTLETLYERRYGLALELLQGCRACYDRLRRDKGRLNYQDLLLEAAALLRDQPHVRRYFQQRFSHLLVDEFQDTDPIQAEVVLLLTAADPEQSDWRQCRPRPGSLFVVGDPKQSIYRFRRADIVTYNEVREVIASGEAEAGGVVHLSANFRCAAAVREWVNRCFAPAFPEAATEFSPSYVALQQGRDDARAAPGAIDGVFKLTVPRAAGRSSAAIVEHEAERIARFIHAALDSMPPSDFLIIARRKRHLSAYAAALTRLGIPHRVAGGTALNEVAELGLLRLALRAVIRPDDPVALVAALRSELFGVSDAELYDHLRAGGRFDHRVRLPQGLQPGTASLLGGAWALLAEISSRLDSGPPMAAIEHLADELGLIPAALSGPAGGDAAGGLVKALELLRAAGAESWTVEHIAERLAALASGEEAHDGIPATTALDCPAVQIMNLHKAKGLEAPVVFLADPTGRAEHPVTMHVDRAGDRIRGFLAMGQGSGYAWRTLAQPPAADWARRVEREQRFLAAEELRLDYVAATRAGQGLVISQRESGNGSNPWQRFNEHLGDAPELPDPGLLAASEVQTESPDGEQVEAALAGVARRRAVITRRGYEVRAAKALALAEAEAGAAAQDDLPEVERGAAWGSVIHHLLELIALEPGADLVQHARPVLREHELDPALAERAAAWIRAVLRSELWARAERSEQRLVEVPFSILARDLDLALEAPTLVRGCIDLAFREQDGWVVVDYKTDTVPAEGLEPLERRYAPQVALYARALERIAGEPVKERGLFFLRADRYVVVRVESRK